MARSFNRADCVLLLSSLERSVVVTALQKHYDELNDVETAVDRHAVYEVLYSLGLPPGYGRSAG